MPTRLPKGLNRRYIFLAIFSLITVWFWVALERPYSFPNHLSWNIYSNSPDDGGSEDVFDFPPVHSAAIAKVCEATKWNESLIFTCDDNVGGIGHIRNAILNCVRFTIAAGAGMILPRISIRNESDIASIHTGDLINMAYLFDTRHFIDSMSLSCPGMKLFSSIQEFKGINNAEAPIRLNAEILGSKITKGKHAPLPQTGLEHPEQWGELFKEWYAGLAEQYKFTGMVQGPAFIGLMRSYLSWPVLSDGEAFATQFGKMLKPRADTRSLATKVLTNLIKKEALAVRIKGPILENAFWGVHLRTEKDSLENVPDAGNDKVYPTYEQQSKLFVDHLEVSKDTLNTSLVYVASGDSTQVAAFWKDAKISNWTVITKAGLLGKNDAVELNNMSWDQQALVDYMVLSKASKFLGVGHSGFDWTVVAARGAAIWNINDFDITAGGKEVKWDVGEISLDSELGVLYGAKNEAAAYKACLWP